MALPVPPSDVVVPHSAMACLPLPQPLPTKPKEHYEKPGDVELQGMALAFLFGMIVLNFGVGWSCLVMSR